MKKKNKSILQAHQEIQKPQSTHQAPLVRIEPIEKKACEHEPRLDSIGRTWCRYCEVALKARWEVAE